VVSYHRFLCALFLSSSSLPAFAEEPVLLRHRIVKDVPIKQEMTTETIQNMKVAGSDIKNECKQTCYFTSTPIELDKNGNWILKQKIHGIKMNIEISGSPPISYDSTKEGAANTPLAEFFKLVVGAEFKITMDDDMKVIKVEGPGQDHRETRRRRPANGAVTQADPQRGWFR
jgi:hypothetical protein